MHTRLNAGYFALINLPISGAVCTAMAHFRTAGSEHLVCKNRDSARKNVSGDACSSDSCTLCCYGRNVYYSGPATSNRPVTASAPPTASEPPSVSEPPTSHSDPSPDLDCSLGDVELAADAVVGHPDLSVIMEQSCFIDHLAIPFTDEEHAGGNN